MKQYYVAILMLVLLALGVLVALASALDVVDGVEEIAVAALVLSAMAAVVTLRIGTHRANSEDPSQLRASAPKTSP